MTDGGLFLDQVKLELQRHQFARQAVSEMRGKLSQSTRQSLEVSFLDTAHIVFTTLNSAGVAALDASARYDVLVVDEAAQAVELSTIIPMKYVLYLLAIRTLAYKHRSHCLMLDLAASSVC